LKRIKNRNRRRRNRYFVSSNYSLLADKNFKILVIKNDLEADNYVGKVNFILNKDIFETNKENISFWQSIYLSVFKDKIREIRMEENEGKIKIFQSILKNLKNLIFHYLI